MPSQRLTLTPHSLLAASRGTARRAAALALAGGALLLAACAAQADATGDPLLARIKAEVGSAACKSDAQCQLLPIGAKACGGPASWLAWSTTVNGKGDNLKRLSAELEKSERARIQKEGLMSPCVITPEPAARCQAGQCVIAEPRLPSVKVQ